MRPVRVLNEFGPLRAAIVHDGNNAIDVTMADQALLVQPDELAKHPEAGSSSRPRLIDQHARFRELLADQGVTLLSPDTRPDAFCQVFARDPCFVIGDTLFVAGMRDAWRHPETDGLRALRGRFAKVVDLSGGGAAIEGGDVLVLDGGRRVLVGMNMHTNKEGVENLRQALAPSGVDVVAVPHRALHLDCCLAPLPNGEALYAGGKLPGESEKVLRGVFSRLDPIDPDEAALQLAANIFWLDERKVVSGVNAKRTNDSLRKKGFEVVELDFSDLVSLWGSFRCTVCPLERG